MANFSLFVFDRKSTGVNATGKSVHERDAGCEPPNPLNCVRERFQGAELAEQVFPLLQ